MTNSARTMLEIDLHLACVGWIAIKAQSDERYKAFHHSPNGEYRRPATGMKLKRMGTRRGFPDLINPIPSGGYNGLAIELKRPGEPLRSAQRTWLMRLRDVCGWQVAVVYDFENFKAGVEEYFSTKPAKTLDQTVEA